MDTAATSCDAITFQTNVYGLKVLGNVYNNGSGSTATFIAPNSGSDLLVGADNSHNHLGYYATSTPVVVLNNLANQTGNYASHNTCTAGTSAGAALECSLLHTAGGNISPWNANYHGTCTITSGTCTAYSFTTTYSAAPQCTASWNGTGTFTGILKVASTTTQVTITDTVNESTGVVNWQCSPEY